MNDLRAGVERWWADYGPKLPAEALSVPMLAGVLAGFVDAAPEPRAAFADAGSSFDLAPEEAIDYFADAPVMTRDVFDDLSAAAKARAFTVAGISDLSILDALKTRIDMALRDGTTQVEWLNQLEETLGAMGVSETADRPLWHLRLVYRQNTSQAYGAGRYEQFQRTKEERPYLEYISSGAPTSRPSHAALNGTIRPVDDPFWLTHYGPWDYECHCEAVSVSREEMEDEGLSVTPDEDIARAEALGPPGPAGFGNPAEFFQAGVN